MENDKIVLRDISPTLTRVYAPEELFGVYLPVGVVEHDAREGTIIFCMNEGCKDLLPQLEETFRRPYEMFKRPDIRTTAFVGKEMLYSNAPIK